MSFPDTWSCHFSLMHALLFPAPFSPAAAVRCVNSRQLLRELLQLPCMPFPHWRQRDFIPERLGHALPVYLIGKGGQSLPRVLPFWAGRERGVSAAVTGGGDGGVVVWVVILFCSASWLCLAPSQFQRARGSLWEVLGLVVFWFVWFLSEFGGFFCCCFSLDFCSLCFGCSHLFILILSFLEQ